MVFKGMKLNCDAAECDFTVTLESIEDAKDHH